MRAVLIRSAPQYLRLLPGRMTMAKQKTYGNTAIGVPITEAGYDVGEMLRRRLAEGGVVRSAADAAIFVLSGCDDLPRRGARSDPEAGMSALAG